MGSPFMPDTEAAQGWTAQASPNATAPSPAQIAQERERRNKLAKQPWDMPQTNTPGALEVPGQQEQAYSQYGGQFWQPGYTEGAYGDVLGGLQGLMQQELPTYNADFYRDFMRTPENANLDVAYDRAWQTGSNRLNREMAARGAYNTSAATQQLSDLAGNLGAQQVRDEANYRLDRARTGGALAGAAGGEAVTNLGQQRSLLDDVFGASQGADAARLNRLGAGFLAAGGAQGATEGRLRGGLEDVFKYSSTVGDVFAQGVDKALYNDYIAMGAPHELAMAMAKAKIDANSAQANNMLQAAGVGVQAIGAL